MSWVIYIYVLVRYSDLLCIVCNPTATLIFDLPEEKRHIIQNSDVAWQSYEWLTRDTSAELREWLEWHSKVLVLNIFLKWKWSWNINWINIWHACIEYSYISFISRHPTSEDIHRRVQQGFIWGHHTPQERKETSPGDLMS